MNKHFEDTRYYVARAGETARRGVAEELEPLERRVRRLAGGEEPEPDATRLDRLSAELRELQGRAEGEAREAIAAARERLDAYRERRAVPAE